VLVYELDFTRDGDDIIWLIILKYQPKIVKI